VSRPGRHATGARGKASPGEQPPLVADAGPLIALAKVDGLQLLKGLFGYGVIPTAVHQEVRPDSGLPGATRIRQALAAGWLQVAPLEDDTLAVELLGLVDAGEAEAIALCRQRQARVLLIDDAKGRKVARRAGLPLVGVAGILLAAKSRGLLSAVGPALEDLAGAGYRLSYRLMDTVRPTANE